MKWNSENKFNSKRLLDKNNNPIQEYFDVFVSSENPISKRKLFFALETVETKERRIYYKLAMEKVFSKNIDFNVKKIILQNISDFYHFTEEGLSKFAPKRLSIRDSAYYELQDLLANYLINSRDISEKEFDALFKCLQEINYFREKRTRMMSIVEFYYPVSIEWFIKRLKVCNTSLRKENLYVGWAVLTFLVSTLNNIIQKLISDIQIEEDKRKICEEIIFEIDNVVPRWLLSSDYKVVDLACKYCYLRNLNSALPLIEEILNTENELVKKTAHATIKKLRSEYKG
ncbi:MAG: hypothetical protein AAGA77_24960 [Bacteroidota bacterium]